MLPNQSIPRQIEWVRVFAGFFPKRGQMHVYRIPSVTRSIISAAIFSLALSFSGCKQATPPPDDAALSSAVQKRIAGDSALKSESIQVSVQNSIATLNGAVSSDAARSLAASDAAQVAGLKTVVNNLTVQQAQQPAQQPTPKPTAAAVEPSTRPARTAPKQPATKLQNESAKHSPAPIERIPPPDQRAQSTPPPPPPPPQPAPPAFRDITVPAGTTLPVRITQTLDSATTQPGENFTATVASDIIIDGLVVVPKGATVSGRVDDVQEAAHFKGNSLLTIELNRLKHRGESVPLSTEPYSVAGKGRGKNTAEKVGGGAAVGAILGGIFGGGKGAAIGAAAGGGLGAGANAATKGQQVQIPSESIIRFHLTNPLTLRVSTANARNTSNPTLQQRPEYQPQ
jgi:hypothetical protein